MSIAQLLSQPEIDPHKWMRDAAAGKITSDPLYDMAIEIVTELQREIEQRGTPWHDIALHDIVADIIRKTLRETLTP